MKDRMRHRIYICLTVSLCVFLSLYLSVFLSVYLSVCMFQFDFKPVCVSNFTMKAVKWHSRDDMLINVSHENRSISGAIKVHNVASE